MEKPKVLSGFEVARDQYARGVGGHRVFPLVRAPAGGTEYRGVDRRCGGDQDQASPKAENRPPRCSTSAEADAGRSFSSNMGTGPRESRSAATALASASAGAHAGAGRRRTFTASGGK